MEITEELARTFLVYQSAYEGETGESEPRWRNLFEDLFPVIKRDRLDYEFNIWLHSIKFEEDPRMISLRKEFVELEKNSVKVGVLLSEWKEYMKEYIKCNVLKDELEKESKKFLKKLFGKNLRYT